MASKNSKPAAGQPAAEQPIAEQPITEQPVAEQPELPAADEAVPEADIAAPEADAPEQSVDDACAELGLTIEDDGHCPVEILASISGGINLIRGDAHRFEAAEAVRAVRAGIAKPRG